MKYTETTGIKDKDMLFSECITGPQGSRFTLYKTLHHSKEDIKKAKSYLKSNFDVVKIYVEND